MFAGKKSAQIREILISESAWEEMTCLFAPSLTKDVINKVSEGARFESKTIDTINSTLEDINKIATDIGLTGTPGIIIMPVNGATEENTTVFSGMTEAENLQQAINKAKGK